MLKDNEKFREALMHNIELVHRNLKYIPKENLAILENDPKFNARLTTVREEFDREEEEKAKINEEIENPEQTEKKEELPKTVDETKFAEIYGKAKGRIKEAFGKIKSFFKEKVFGKNNDTNDTNDQR